MNTKKREGKKINRGKIGCRHFFTFKRFATHSETFRSMGNEKNEKREFPFSIQTRWEGGARK